VPALFACEADAASPETEVTVLPTNDFLAGTAKMTVGHGIELSGLVVDGAGKPVAGVAITRNHEWRNPAAELSSEADGRFSIVNLRAGEMILTFQAAGLAAQTRELTLSNQMPELKIEMTSGRVFRGRVVDESGQAIAGASVQMDRVPLGPLEYDWSTTTGEDGRFLWDSAPEGEHPYYITADGFHSMSEPALAADGTDKMITLRKARDGDKTVISGTVRDAVSHAPMREFAVRVKEFNGAVVSNFQMTVSGTNGNYEVGVNPAASVCQIVMAASGHLASEGESLSPADGDQRMDVELTPGIVREVVGKFTVPGYEGTIDWTANRIATLLTVVPPPAIATMDRAAGEKEFEEFLETDKGRAWQRAHRSFDVAIDSIGAFKIEDVPAGTFELRANLRQSGAEGGETIASLATQFTVADSGGAETPMDMGPVAIPLKKILKANDTAPDFEIKTVDGQPLRLADFRGKYVLLDFWATWCGPCVGEMPNLKSTYEAFGGDDRFAMVSLSLDSNPSAPKAFAQKNGIKWTQGFLGNWSEATATKAYGVDAIPAIFLIGPDGKIIERNLRGEEIRAAVARALGNQR
jgi:peroxiredoxin